MQILSLTSADASNSVRFGVISTAIGSSLLGVTQSFPWDWPGIGAGCQHPQSTVHLEYTVFPLICPVHTPIRRRREGWSGESVGHVASPKDTLYCVLAEDYMEQAKIEDTHKFPGQATP